MPLRMELQQFVDKEQLLGDLTSGSSASEGTMLRRLLVTSCASVSLAHKCQPALKLRAEVGFGGGNLDRLARGFASEPAIQFFPRGFDISTLAFRRHAFTRPSLNDRNWLTEKGRDLPPPF